MWFDIINNVLALLVGVFTGFYFERRATQQARQDADEAAAHNLQLRETLRDLRAELVSRSGGASAARNDIPRAISADLAGEALDYARDRQDASGCISVSGLRNGLIARGFAVADIDQAISVLVERKALRQQGAHWEVQA